jgi:hypothetical protein
MGRGALVAALTVVVVAAAVTAAATLSGQRDPTRPPAPGWPDHPPAAALAVGTATATASWLPITPVQYAWFVPTRGTSPLVGPLPRNWLRVPDCHGARTPVLYLAASPMPDVVQLLRYRTLARDGLPDGPPDPVACTARAGCAERPCAHDRVRGMCIAVDSAGHQADRVVVVFALWTVPGVPLAVIKQDGPPADAASWGFVLGSAGKGCS